MKQHFQFTSCLLACAVAILGGYACDEDSSSDSKVSGCVPECSNEQTCSNGECVPKTDDTDKKCDPECDGNSEECVDGECVPKDIDDDAVSDSCDPACDERHTCVEGICAPKSVSGGDDSDVDNDDVIDEDTTEVEDDEPVEDDVKSVLVTPVDGLVTIQNSQNAVFSISLSHAPAKDVVIPIYSQNEEAGTLSSNGLTFSPDNWDSQQEITITATTKTLEQKETSYVVVVGPSQSEDYDFNNLEAVNVKVTHFNAENSGGVAPDKLTLNMTEASLLLKGDPVKIVAELDKSSSDQNITWEIKNITDDVDINKLVSIQYDNASHSITLQNKVIPNSSACIKYKLDLARTLIVTAKHSSGVDAKATVELKPYMKLGLTLTQLKDVRNLKTPGHANSSSDEVKDDLDNLKCGYYDDHTTQVLNYDMVNDVVSPFVYSVGGSNYGTRASVVAAARFLVLQFPKDIPYASGEMFDSEPVPTTVARYTWTSYDYNKDRNKVRIFGLNLTEKAYNSFTSFEDSNVILGGSKGKITPWGCKVTSYVKDGEAVKSGEKTVKNPFNGLRCSGFVSWAMMNGRFYLSDWVTALFGRNGQCKDGDNLLRNFRCEDNVYDTNGKHLCNANGKHFAVFSKLNELKEEDFVHVSDLTTNSDIKAGDLLLYGKYKCKKTADGCSKKANDCTGGGGHVAMILGISRKDDGAIKYVYVAEATGSSGNHLRTYSIKSLNASDSKWHSTMTENSKSCTYKDARLIKMDNVYNYYHTKNPDKVKEDLNSYKYSELWF